MPITKRKDKLKDVFNGFGIEWIVCFLLKTAETAQNQPIKREILSKLIDILYPIKPFRKIKKPKNPAMTRFFGYHFINWCGKWDSNPHA